MHLFSFLKTACAGAMMGLLLVFPAEGAQAALEALTVFVTSVLPALLPFSVCALLLTAGRRLPLALLALLALPGGSPTGARLFQDAGLSPRQALRYAACTGGMSPMFFLFTLSRWLGSPRAGGALLGVHLFSALLAALFFPRGAKGRVRLPPLSAAQAMSQGAQAMGTVAACVALGAAGARLAACALPGLPPLPLALAQSLLEVTLGCRALLGLALPARWLFPLLSALTAFTGAAILLQNAAFWKKSGLGAGALAGVGLLRGGIAFLLCGLLVQLCRI